MKGKDKVDLDVLKHADAFDHYKFWEPKNKSGSLSRKLQSEAWIDGIKGQFPTPLMIFSLFVLHWGKAWIWGRKKPQNTECLGGIWKVVGGT
jgi:hypothetical protein